MNLKVTGANDTPTVTAVTKALTDQATQDAGTVVSSVRAGVVTGGVLGGDSVCDGDTLAVSAVAGSALNVGADVAGTYGTLHLNSDGSYSYTANSAYDALKATDHVSDVFSFTVSDGTTTVTKDLTFNIAGANDTPTVTAVTKALTDQA